MIIAVDFDGTLCEDAYPEIGSANFYLILQLKGRQAMGDKLILWTCRAGEALAEAVEWCSHYGLHFDAINDNVPETLAKYGNNSRKITADIYLDDRAEKPWQELLAEVV